MLIPDFLLRHQVTMEAWEGEGPYGPVYAAPVLMRCFLDEQTRMVRSPAGEEVTSSSTPYAVPDARRPEHSRVTLPDGRQSTVIAALKRDGCGLPTPDHLEVQLQ
ncbi:hypothetical protein [Streptomyces flavofungini]|uniref:hypothetical protein n=1 Tax=Streptomyces flavofungini TaxID=68200 RepID=UPI0025AF1AD2|nr:hypothetical protein [Streptomyces flavofungini]WJV47520.1 hypothetical protein QUY26_19500 [Streptomyces flavofungini]